MSNFRMLFLPAFLFVSGCVHVELTPSGEKAKIIEASVFDKSAGCKFVTNFKHITYFKVGGANQEVVIGDLRNKIGSTGGNLGVTTFRFDHGPYAVVGIGTQIPVQVYNCDEGYLQTVITID